MQSIFHVSDSLATGGEQTGDDVELGGFGRAVDRAIDRGVDALVHTGNLFQRPTPESRTVEAVVAELDALAAASIPMLMIAGNREARGDALDRVSSHDVIYELNEQPTRVGELAFYGVDYVSDAPSLEDALESLEPTQTYTYNVVCVHDRVWPPVGKHQATISSFDLMEAADVHVNEVLAGGFEEARTWESDDFDYQVTYSGSSNPERLGAGETPVGTLLRADADERTTEQIPLVTTGVQAELEHLRQALDFDPSDLDDADTETLADLYGLAARAKKVFDDRRKELRDELLERVEDDRQIEGQFASVDRRTRRRRSVRSEDRVFQAIDQAGIDRDEVLTLDSSTLRELAEAGKLDEEEIFETDLGHSIYVNDVSL